MLSLGAVVLGLAAIELGLGVSGLAGRMVGRALYYQYTEVEAFRPALEPITPGGPLLLYELAPGGRVVGAHRDYTVNIGRHGTRLPDHPEVRRPDWARVLFLGASTLYGAGVNDVETMAAGLELALQNRVAVSEGPLRGVEVWNYGTSAYRLSQMALLGLRELERRQPDLLLVLFTNTGRRPFLLGAMPPDPWSLFERDATLLTENFPLAHPPAMQLASYRYVTAHRRRAGDEDASEEADRLSRELAGQLVARADELGVPVVFITVPGQDWLGREPDWYFPPGHEAEARIDLFQEGREDEFYEVHPPPHILLEYGETIAAELIQRGHLPLPVDPPDAPAIEVLSPRDGDSLGASAMARVRVDPGVEVCLRTDLDVELGCQVEQSGSGTAFSLAALPSGVHTLVAEAARDGVVARRALTVGIR